MEKGFEWNQEKNEQLKMEGVSFEDVVFHISNGDLLDILEHPNRDKYPNQKIFVIRIKDYAYYIPFVEDENKIFLKTIIPNRNFTKTY